MDLGNFLTRLKNNADFSFGLMHTEGLHCYY